MKKYEEFIYKLLIIINLPLFFIGIVEIYFNYNFSYFYKPYIKLCVMPILIICFFNALYRVFIKE